MNWSPKIVTVLCFLQAFFIVAGYLFVHVMFKFVHEDAGDDNPTYISNLVQFVYSFGLWTLLVPIVWCIFATLVHADSEGGWVSIPSIQVVLGVALTIFIVGFYSIASLQALGIPFQFQPSKITSVPDK